VIDNNRQGISLRDGVRGGGGGGGGGISDVEGEVDGDLTGDSEAAGDKEDSGVVEAEAALL